MVGSLGPVGNYEGEFGQQLVAPGVQPWPGVMEGAPAGNDYKPGFMVDLMAKDLGLAIELAEQSSVDADFGRRANAVYQALQADGLGEMTSRL